MQVYCRMPASDPSEGLITPDKKSVDWYIRVVPIISGCDRRGDTDPMAEVIM